MGSPSSGSGSISGPPFAAQLLTGALPAEMQGSLGVYFASDTLSASTTTPGTTSTNSLAPGLSEPSPIAAKDYMDAISSAIGELKNLLNFSDANYSLWNIARWRDTYSLLESLADMRNKMLLQSKQETDLYKTQQTQIATYNAALQKYNSALSQANSYTFAMHTIQTQYLNGTLSTAQYNAEVARWNSTVEAQNTALQTAYNQYLSAANTFNSQVAANNQLINELNATRTFESIGGQLTPQTPVSIPSAPQLMPTGLSQGPAQPAPPTIPQSERVPSGYAPLPPLASSVKSSVSTQIDLEPLSPAEAQLFAAIKLNADTLNAAILNYNTALAATKNAATTMQQAFINYQKGIISQEAYDEARQKYLTAAATANAQLKPLAEQYIAALEKYNSNLSGFNAQIDQFNALRREGNHTEIPPQLELEVPELSSLLLPIDIPTNPSASDADPFAAFNSAILPTSPQGSSTPTTTQAFLDKFYKNVFDLELAAFKAYTNVMSLQGAYREMLHTVLSGKINTLPNNSFLQNFTQVYLSSGAAGANPGSGGVAAIAGIVGLDSVALSAIISQALFSEAVLNFINAPAGQLVKPSEVDAKASPVPAGLIKPSEIAAKASEALALVALQSLQKASVFSGLPALGMLINNLENVAPHSPPTDVAVSFSSLKSLTGLIGSGGLQENIATALGEVLKDFGLSSAQISEIVKIATAALSVGLLLFGVLSVSRALSLPGLTGQLVGSAFDQDIIGKLIAQLSGTTVTSVLENPVSVVFLKEALAEQLLNKSLASQRQEAQALAHRLIDQIVSSPNVRTDLDLRAALTATFQQAGFRPADVVDLTNTSASFVRRELQVRGLDSAFSQRKLDSQLLQNPLFFKPQLQQAVAALREESFETIRQFRDALSGQLAASGIAKEEGDELANQAAYAIQPSELKRSFDATQIDAQKLAASLLERLGEDVALQITRDVLALQPHSEQHLREALEQQIKLHDLSNLEAQRLAATAVIVFQQSDPLKTFGNGQMLSADELVTQLVKATTNQLKIPLGMALAAEMSNQLATLLLGTPPSSQQVYINDINNSASVIYQLKSAVDYLIKIGGEKAVVAMQEDFARTMKPTVSMLDLLERYLDPANSLVLSGAWGLMYSGTNAEPSNFKKSIDIRI